MKITLRKKDYIISFVVIFVLLLLNVISGPKNWTEIILKSLGISIVGSLLVGSITNVLFGKKTEEK